MKKGIVWIVVGLAVMIFDRLYPTFIVNLWGLRFDLGILAVLYGVLQIIADRITMSKMTLTDAEVAEYGSTLEKVTPKILEMFNRRYKVKEIADSLQRTDGLPKDVTLRYIIALLRQIQHNEAAEAPPK
ncbi:MAG: hypothetical protein KC609_17500 [Myxococcales bacterium]|nr:hypothetical protein [Myxococcales bacterium]